MSKLKNNTAELQALLIAVDELPSADVGGDSGGPGGGGVETCTVSLSLDAPSPEPPTVRYTDENMNLVTETIPGGLRITVVKNTMIVTNGGSSMDEVESGDAEKISSSMGISLFAISGDASIMVCPM